MRRNKLREMLDEGKSTIGAPVISMWPGTVEIIGRTGVADYIDFLGEYAPWDLNGLENIAARIELFDMSSMFKVDQEPRAFIAQRALGCGMQNILFADVRTVEDAQECVRCVKPETPEGGGTNGCHARRNAGYGLEGGSPEYVKAMEDAVICLMIEKKDAVDNLEEILSVKGIDMVYFGPGDYSMSIGLPRQWSHPKVEEAELKTIKTALKMGVRPRISIEEFYTDKEAIKKYIDLGVRDFTLPNDLRAIYILFKQHGESLGKMLSSI